MEALKEKRPEELDSIYEGLTGLRDLYMEDPGSRGINGMLKVFQEYMEAFFLAMDEKKMCVLYNGSMSPEILWALEDVLPVSGDIIGCLQAMFGDNQYNREILDLVEARGLSPDVCSINKLGHGYLMKNLLPEYVCAVYQNTPCDHQTMASQIHREISSVPFFYVDVPDLSGDREIKYVARQLREQIRFLEECTGKKFSWDRLREVCEKNNRMMEHILEWCRWRATVPCPQNSKLASMIEGIIAIFSGTEWGVYAAAEMLAEAKEKALKGESAVPGGEKVRAVWYQAPVLFDTSIYDWLESELGVVVPMDLYGYVVPEGIIDTSTPESLLEGLARKHLTALPMTRQFKGPVDIYLQDFIKVIEIYKADCAIFAGHLGCKMGWASIGLLQEALREIDIPLLTFEFDMLDPRVASTETLQEKISRFVNDVVLPRLKPKR